ncbi:unnamed protein product [Boreogadus saida]
MKKSKIADQTAAGQGGIRKKSKVPGVMITQFQEELPEDATTPDFTRKPIALTIQEGKLAVFKAKVMGTPTPKVSWGRANGEIVFHPETCLQKFDEVSGEHTLEFNKVDPDDADTYKCFATNDHGRAVCTVVLNVIEVGFRKKKEQKVEEPSDLRKTTEERNADGSREEKPMDNEEKVWEILLSADKKDYESICVEYGITNFRGMLTRLTEMRKEKEAEVAQSRTSALRSKSKRLKAVEREKTLSSVRLTDSHERDQMVSGVRPLEDGEKFQILVSEDKLIHKLIVKDVMPLEIYAAVAGIKSCNTF